MRRGYTPDLPMEVASPPRRLNNHERKILRRLIYALAGREEWNILHLMPEALAICDNKIAPIRRRSR